MRLGWGRGGKRERSSGERERDEDRR